MACHHQGCSQEVSTFTINFFFFANLTLGVPPFPPNGQMPPFRPSNDGVVPAGGMPGPPSSFNGPPPDASGTSSTIPPPGSGGMPGGMHPDRLRMLGK